MKEDEMAADMGQVTQQMIKIGSETDSLKSQIDILNQKVADLEEQLANEEIKPETQDAWDALKEQVNVVDAKVDDISSLTKKS